MPDQSPELEEVVEAGVDAALAGLWTSVPAKVLEFDRTRQVVDAQPLVRVAYIDESGERALKPMPKCVGVPFTFPRSGERGMTWDVQEGDLVWLHFASCALDQWLATRPGQTVDPGFDRRNHPADAFAVPGAFPAFGPGGVPSTVEATTTIIHEPVLLKLGGPDAIERVARVKDLEHVILRLEANILALTPGLPGTADQIAILSTVLSALLGTFPGLPSWPEGSARVQVP